MVCAHSCIRPYILCLPIWGSVCLSHVLKVDIVAGESYILKLLIFSLPYNITDLAKPETCCNNITNLSNHLDNLDML